MLLWLYQVYYRLFKRTIHENIDNEKSIEEGNFALQHFSLD